MFVCLCWVLALVCFGVYHLKIYGSLKHREGMCVIGRKREQRGDLRHLSINHYLTLFPNGLLHLLVTLTRKGWGGGIQKSVALLMLNKSTTCEATVFIMVC